MIVEEEVVGDPRSHNRTNGPWSFRHLIGEMIPAGSNPADLTLSWLRSWEQRDFAGQPLDPPNETREVRSKIICPWLKRTPSNGCDELCKSCTSEKLDMELAPFRLLAISNRIDLHRQKQTDNHGEGRFVFALTDGPGDDAASAPLPMTVIFEYRLPVSKSDFEWANLWHSLGKEPNFSEAYRAKLEAITRLFSTRNASPERPNGSAISQVRTNESALNWIWQLREFRIQGGALTIAPTVNTPSRAFNNAPALAKWVSDNREEVLSANFVVPSSFLGGSADLFSFRWSLPNVDEQARRAFEHETCMGCHSGANPSGDLAFHVSPFKRGREKLSPFMYDVGGKLGGRTKDELTVRTRRLQEDLCAAK